jgi:mitogen-activated protein kinase kinase 7
MSISGIIEENKRILMDLEVVLKSNDCRDIVKCLGYLISVSDVWICMELMSMCFDKVLKLIKTPIPEEILGKLIVSVLFRFCLSKFLASFLFQLKSFKTLNALNYLKEQHNVIHRGIYIFYDFKSQMNLNEK